VDIAKVVQRNVGKSELCRLYVELVRCVPEVQLVAVLQEGEAVYITTVIEAPPFQRQIRDKIYSAQRAVLEKNVTPSVEFRLVNSCEIQEDIDKIVPTDARRLYVRK